METSLERPGQGRNTLDVIRIWETAQEYRKIGKPLGKRGADGMRMPMEVEIPEAFDLPPHRIRVFAGTVTKRWVRLTVLRL